MTSAIVFALLSLLFAGLNDVVFKRYSSKDRSRGMIVFGIGVVWLLLQSLTIILDDGRFLPDTVTLGYGLTAGIILALSNILLIEGLTQTDVSAGSTIYRLNTIGVVLLSVVFLQEPLGWLKMAGISSGVLAVLLLMHQSHAVDMGRMATLYIWLVVLASLLRAIYGVISKVGLNQGADTDSMLLVAAFCWVIGGALYALLREGRFRLTRKKTAYALVSGLLVYLIVNFLLAAIARGEASVVIPIANLSFIAALLISVVLGMERLSVKKLTAVLCAIGSIWLLALP
ncbi:MAG: DMT family transporter [Candidatus Thiodiazotropha sp.]|nr:DMT family transporter [Candidatus Thiodiazotropha sp.]MCM8881718.1 DMT family transporter [Candidatus Thiodiazotropha sp.]MCM8920811.1 DMT family transporter [Candidatus Thiodiazotropha sp.]